MTFYHLNLSRSGLPSEALEEFLSILRPSFFPPTSPILRTRRQGASLPTFQHERSFSYKSRGRLEIASQKNDGDDIDISRSTQPSRNTCPSTPDSLNDPDGMTEPDGDSPSLRWFKANILGESLPCFARLPLTPLILGHLPPQLLRFHALTREILSCETLPITLLGRYHPSPQLPFPCLFQLPMR